MSATIAARAHSNATLSAPARRARPARRGPSWFEGIWRAVWRRPGRSLVFFLFGAAAVAILLNAVAFQKVRHPAPMAAVPATVTPPSRPAELRAEPAARAEAPAAAAGQAVPALSAPPALPPSRPGGLSSHAVREAPRPPATITAAQRPAPAAQPAAAAQTQVQRSQPSRDPIADLINGDLRPPAEIRGVASAKSAVPRRTAEN